MHNKKRDTRHRPTSFINFTPKYRSCMTRPIAFCSLVFLTFISISDVLANHSVRGRIINRDGEPLQGATARLTNTRDTTKILGGISNRRGEFSIADVPQGAYTINLTLLGYAPLAMPVTVGSSDVELPEITLNADTLTLKNISVEADAIAVEMKGDTTQFNSKAYKTNAYASSEDLVKKMPGISIEDGTVKAQGEEVKRVLVDGKRFFGDDARQTLQNVPSDMVDNVQVYDARSSTSMFSGFDDGGTEKTINLVTKKDKRKGSFGSVYGGYGTDDRYSGGLTYNAFNDTQRLTVLGISNNINQQNFSVQDILAGMGITGGRARMMGAMASRMGPSRFMGNSGLFVGQQDGITATHAVGVQYSDSWFDKFDVSGSYFFNYADNNNSSVTDRQYVDPDTQTYSETSNNNSIGRNHRFNLRMSGPLNSRSQILIEPKLSYQQRSDYNAFDGLTMNADLPLSQSVTTSYNAPGALTAGIDANYSLLLNTSGRTLAVEASTELRASSAEGTQQATNTFGPADSLFTLNQQTRQNQDGTTLRGTISFTEPLAPKTTLMVQYSPSIRYTSSDKGTKEYDSVTAGFTQVVPDLTNTYSNTYTVHNAQVLFRQQFINTIVTAGVAYQLSALAGDVTSPAHTTVRRSFSNLLPNMMVRQRFSEQTELTLRYSMQTDAPSITDLQNVIDNSNSLQLRTGNPDLDESTTHNVRLHFRDANWMAGKTMFAFASADFTNDYVASSTIVTTADTTISGVFLPRGSTITSPVNMDGYIGVRSFFSIGRQLSDLKINLNLNGGVTYARTPSLVNNLTNYSNSSTLRLGTYISSNISEDIDFSVGYNGNYNIITNSVIADQDANYFTHSATARVIWNFGVLACSTDVAHSYYTGLGEGFDRTFTVWNAGLGYRFLGNAAELRFSVFDILKQNASISRTVNPVSIDNISTTMLTRYAMLTFSYQLRNFDAANMPQDRSRPPFGRH
ncbi:MAG: hypothetical protein D8M52_05270 [Chlorobi bacterium]|nr:MAG: outer membrane beta-barrel protein [Bacteroidota bacterium]KXK34469.1 MAG: Outer membrane receptor protein [Chlorobi bacterium OLB6]MBL1161112.1 hypothetical protein [Chlorobiota bacterium]MBV6464736.1 hypothetical protein [Chlorobiota bacterium]